MNRKTNLPRLLLLGSLLVPSLLIALVGIASTRPASDAAGDWPMWGGTPDRNMISSMTGLPETWDVEEGKNVRWVAALGSQTYGDSLPHTPSIPLKYYLQTHKSRHRRPI